jgi:two-component system, chemotaxis family, chemotaxis protein CheY
VKLNLTKKDFEKRIQSLSVLVIDDNQYFRKLVRTLLMTIGVKNVSEAGDGVAGIDSIRSLRPDIVILDWELPLLDGAEVVRIVRSPGVFPMPEIPIIMLTGHCEHWRAVRAMQLGVHEFLIKPVSAKTLSDRIVSILANPRSFVRVGDYYGPKPRKSFTDRIDAAPSAPAPVGAASNQRMIGDAE